MPRISRLWQTLSPQRPQQWYGRIADTLKRKTYDRMFLQSSLQRGIADAFELRVPDPLPQWIDHECDVDLVSRRFCFLNEAKEFDNQIDWQFNEFGYLWRFNLHYFEYLPSSGEAGTAIVKDWIANNPAPSQPGWHPYVISLRIIHWCKWLWANPQCADQKILRSLAQQANYLAGHLEYRLLGNHLMENARALLFASVAMDVPVATMWRKKADEILKIELEEQVLPDGLHFERSWMYHGLMLVAYLDIVLLGRAGAMDTRSTTVAESSARNMTEALQQGMCVDNRYPLFKDAAQGIAPPPEELIAFASGVLNMAPAPRCEVISIDGFHIHRDDITESIIEAGRLLPTYNPGHAHADLFSYQVHLHGRPLVVDTGTSTYERGPQREHERSTAAHNTVNIDGQNSSDVWAGFRVGRRAEPHDVKWYMDGDLTVFEGWHDGYRHLAGRPRHHRTIVHLKNLAMIVLDRIESEGSAEHHVESAIHIAPDRTIQELSATQLNVGRARLLALHDDQWKTAASQHAPEFGKRLNNVRISLVKRSTGLVDIGYIWSWRGDITRALHDKNGGLRLILEAGNEVLISRNPAEDTSGGGRWRITS